MSIRLLGGAASLAILLFGGVAPEADASCSCRHPASHRYVRSHRPHRVFVRHRYGPPVVAARAVVLDPGWRTLPVGGREIAPDAPNPLHDPDSVSRYLGMGGTSAAELHLPSGRGLNP